MPASIAAAIRRGTRAALACVVLGATTASCGDSTTPLLEFVTLSVAPYRVPCTGAFPMTCMVVQRLPDTRDEYFYDSISGFTFEQGYRQVLRVRVIQIVDPLADGSSVAYVLVRVLERRQELVLD